MPQYDIELDFILVICIYMYISTLYNIYSNMNRNFKANKCKITLYERTRTYKDRLHHLDKLLIKLLYKNVFLSYFVQ